MTGTLAAGVARGLEREEVLRLAVAAGALNVTRRGLGTGERHAVERLARAVALRPAAGA
jgi:1-phosphofructokinase